MAVNLKVQENIKVITLSTSKDKNNKLKIINIPYITNKWNTTEIYSNTNI